MTRGVSKSEWIYLGLSVAASYALIMMQRDPNYDLKLKVLASGIRVTRFVEQRIDNLRLWLTREMDKALEDYQC